MQKYKSHKVVEAARIMSVVPRYGTNDDLQGAVLYFPEEVTPPQFVDTGWLIKHAPIDCAPWPELVGGFFVRYDGEDAYTSWSPAEAFLSGYAIHSLDPKDGALPVSGYKPQTPAKVEAVNGFKADEERILRKLDDLTRVLESNVDHRWLAIGRTGLEQAFMAINRAVFQPGRARLPEDD